MLTSPSAERFVAVDVHKHYVVAGAVTAQQQIVLAPRRVDLDDLPDWSQRSLRQQTPWCWKRRPTPGTSVISFVSWSPPSQSPIRC